jgi:hypothetical protein
MTTASLIQEEGSGLEEDESVSDELYLLMVDTYFRCVSGFGIFAKKRMQPALFSSFASITLSNLQRGRVPSPARFGYHFPYHTGSLSTYCAPRKLQDTFKTWWYVKEWYD